MKYCKVLSDNSYLVDIPPRIHLVHNCKIVEQGNVNLYREYKEMTESGYYYLQAEINHIIKNNVKLFVKRFDKNYNFIGKIEYVEAVEGVNKSMDAVAATGDYSDQMREAARKLAEMNTYYDLQLKTMQNMGNSVSDTEKFQQEIARLGENLESLNKVYSNMLNAMNK